MRDSHAAMQFDDKAIRRLRAFLGDFILGWRRGGERLPPPRELYVLYQLLANLGEAGSARGTKTIGQQEESKQHQWIDTAEAAKIMKCSTRYVTKIAPALDGTLCGGRWIFPRHAVIEHAEGKQRS